MTTPPPAPARWPALLFVLLTALLLPGCALLRGGASDEAIAAAIAPIWQQRKDRYSELRGSLPASTERIEMSYIGG